MATQVETLQAPATQEVQENPNQTSERQDHVVGYNLDPGKNEKNEDVTIKNAAFYNLAKEDDVAKLKARQDSNTFQEAYRVTVSTPRAKNIAGIKEICPDEAEAANNFNRGAKQKVNNRLNAKLTATDEEGNLIFDPQGVDKDGNPNLTNGVLDMRSEIASRTIRKVRTEEEKLDDFLEQFPEATRQMMKQAYLASRNVPQAA